MKLVSINSYIGIINVANLKQVPFVRRQDMSTVFYYTFWGDTLLLILFYHLTMTGFT